MAAPSYRIGPSDFFTPGDLQADADTLNGQIGALDNTIDGNEAIPQLTFDQWDAWLASWRGFYTSHFGGFFTDVGTALNDANRDQLIQYENAFVSWAATLGNYGSQLAAPIVQPSSGSGDTLGAHLSKQIAPIAATLGMSAATLLFLFVGFVVVWFIWKGSK